ncbi:MAG: protein-glutamate O-methyltransferase CheR [Thermodesulfobacteriota bacterium]
MMRISPEEFVLWSEYIYELTGIVLPANKNYLIENRLSELAFELNCASFQELLFKCRYSAETQLVEKVINRISTQETSFFRDRPVYEALERLLIQEIIPAKRRAAVPGLPLRLKVWSTACSHGQEPYSLAMVLSECLPNLEDWYVSILASDIADNAFKRASIGRYSELEVQRGLSPYYLEKYFQPAGNGSWLVKDKIRRLVNFQRMNLVADSFSHLGPFDIIFCRNVAIYFDHPTKIRLFEKLEKVLTPDGKLFLGATENLTQIVTIFQPLYRYNVIYYAKTNPVSPPAITSFAPPAGSVLPGTTAPGGESSSRNQATGPGKPGSNPAALAFYKA